METIEGNKLIAAFDGWALPIGGFAHAFNGHNKNDKDSSRRNSLIGFEDCVKIEDTQYHTSWDWLMPVVEKIESCFDDVLIVRINDKRCTVELDTQEAMRLDENFNVPDCYSGFCDTKIQAVYSTVTQFIQWYNTILNK